VGASKTGAVYRFRDFLSNRPRWGRNQEYRMSQMFPPRKKLSPMKNYITLKFLILPAAVTTDAPYISLPYISL